MNLFLRFLLLLLRVRKIRPRGFSQLSSLDFRVLPTDSDWFQHHLTNSRFPSFMDLGRIDWLAHAGLYRPMRGRGWGIVVSASQITYLGLIRWGEKFTLETRPVFWDQKYIYLEHRFVSSSGRLKAVALSKLVFAGKQGSLALGDMLEAAGLTLEQPPLKAPDHVQAFQHALTFKH